MSDFLMAFSGPPGQLAPADRAEILEAAERAEIAASTAESVVGPTYVNTAAGLAATTEGGSFAVDNGDGTVTIWRKVSGVAVAQRTLATTDALAADGGAALIGTSAGATVQTLLDQRNPVVSDIEGATDAQPDVMAALAASYTDHNRPLDFRTGNYLLEDTVTVTQGVVLRGEGSQGSTEGYGTVFQIAHANDAFVWDGSGGAFHGTGGGLRDVLITKQAGFQGGAGIRIEAQNDEHRPGEMILSNVLVYPVGDGSFTNGLVIDGRAANTDQTRGVRSVWLFKCRFAGATEEYKTVLITQVSHFFAWGLAVDPFSGVNAGAWFDGINDGVFLPCGDVAGRVTIDADDGRDTDGTVTVDTVNATDNFHYQGKVSEFVNNDHWTTGTVLLSHGVASVSRITNYSKWAKFVADLAPDFKLTSSADLVNVTGDGTTYTLVYDTVVYDFGNDFVGAGPNYAIFVCSVAGAYLVTPHVRIGNVGAGFTLGRLQVEITRAADSSTELVVWDFAPSKLYDATGALTIPAGATIVSLEHGDTVLLQLQISGGTKTVWVSGSGSLGIFGSFSMKYVP